MMADTARHTELSVSFDGVDISMIVNKYLISLNYVDNEEDDADDLQIKLEDRSGTWLQKWLNDTIQSAGNSYSAEGESAETVTVNDTHAGIRKTVSKGSSSYDAAICQIYLEALGYLTTGVVAKANDDTVSAIKDFQTQNKLGSNGKCNKKTWKKLIAAVQGRAIPKYDCEFVASGNVALRKSAKSNAKKIATIAKGEKCFILDHVKSSWYLVEYNGQTGYTTAKNLTASLIYRSMQKDTSSKTKGLGIRASITSFAADGTKTTTDCGLFELDDIKASGPPATVTIKGTSLGYNGMRKTKNDKSWENYTLQRIAEEIGKKAGLGLLYDCAEDPKYDRIEQAKQTDIAFLKKLCQDRGYALKITNNQIVIFEQEKYEAMDEVATITFGDGSYTKWSLATGEGEVEYASCLVTYTDPLTGKAIMGEAYAEGYKADDEDNETLIISDQRVSSAAEANELAQKLLKLNNKLEREVSLTVKGNPMYAAGLTVRLNGFGYWSGKYLISKAKHDVSSSGYTTTLTLRKVGEVENSEEHVYKVGDIVNFKGGPHYSKANAKKAANKGKDRKAGLAKIVKIADMSNRHPYKLQGGYYNVLNGGCNVNGWVDKYTFE